MPRSPQPVPPTGLDQHVLQAEEAYKNCTLCPHECGINRFESHEGRCGLGTTSHIYKEFLHWGEEPQLSPSYTIYLTGCSLRCVFCSEWDPVTRPREHGQPLIPEELASRITEAGAEGAKTISFVGGEPGVNMLPVLQTLKLIPHALPIVWNTNLYSSEQALRILAPHIDLWLVDLKFGSSTCARRLSGRQDYLAKVQRALTILKELSANVMIRHLLMPDHLECCTLPALRWLGQNHPEIPVNIMSHFLPIGSPKSPLKLSPSAEDKEQLKSLLRKEEHGHWMWNGQPVFPDSRVRD